jgi:hypothetical protein
MMTYPKVHNHVDATLRWSGAEAQGSSNATMAHCILLEQLHRKESP